MQRFCKVTVDLCGGFVKWPLICVWRLCKVTTVVSAAPQCPSICHTAASSWRHWQGNTHTHTHTHAHTHTHLTHTRTHTKWIKTHQRFRINFKGGKKVNQDTGQQHACFNDPCICENDKHTDRQLFCMKTAMTR